MKLKVLSAAVILAVTTVGVAVAAPIAGAAAPHVAAHSVTKTATTSGLNVPIKGTFTQSGGGLKGPGTLTGSINIESFFTTGGKLYAVGSLTGVLKDASGATQNVTQDIVLPLTPGHGHPRTCSILRLDVGAIHLNLLGLVVDLSPIHLRITGQTGPGNLLGNLLCGIAGLLNGGLSNNQMILEDVVTLLNQALAQM